MAQIWRGKEASIELEQDGSTYPIGQLQDVEVERSGNVETLLGAGSKKIQDKQETELEINVSATVSAWDVDSWKQLIDYDSTNDNIKDTSEVNEFTIKGTFEATDGTTLNFDVIGVDFEDLPIAGGQDEWIEMELNGRGTDIENVSTSTA